MLFGFWTLDLGLDLNLELVLRSILSSRPPTFGDLGLPFAPRAGAWAGSGCLAFWRPPAFFLPLEGHHLSDREFRRLVLTKILIVRYLGRDLVGQELLDGRESVHILVAGQGVCLAPLARPRGPANAVNIVLWILGDVVVDYVSDIINVPMDAEDRQHTCMFYF